MIARRIAVLGLSAVLVLAAKRPAEAQELKPTLERIAQAWHRGDVDAIAALRASTGVSLDIIGIKVGPLQDARRSAVALKSAFLDRESVSTKVTSAREVGEDSKRAYGSIAWQTRVRGTITPESATIYIGLVREEGGWRVYEIRLLAP